MTYKSTVSAAVTAIVYNYFASRLYVIGKASDNTYNVLMLAYLFCLHRSSYSVAYEYADSRRSPGVMSSFSIACMVTVALLIIAICYTAHSTPPQSRPDAKIEFLIVCFLMSESTIIGYLDVYTANEARKADLETAVYEVRTEYVTKIAALEEKLRIRYI